MGYDPQKKLTSKINAKIDGFHFGIIIFPLKIRKRLFTQTSGGRGVKLSMTTSDVSSMMKLQLRAGFCDIFVVRHVIRHVQDYNYVNTIS